MNAPEYALALPLASLLLVIGAAAAAGWLMRVCSERRTVRDREDEKEQRDFRAATSRNAIEPREDD